MICVISVNLHELKKYPMRNYSIPTLLRAFLIVTIYVCFTQPANAQTTVKQQFYRNPVLGGDYPDPSVIRVGKDFYMTHSSFEYYPGLLV